MIVLLETFFLLESFQIEAIVGEHGIVVITRSGSSPEQFIFQSDLLTKFKVKINLVFHFLIAKSFKMVSIASGLFV